VLRHAPQVRAVSGQGGGGEGGHAALHLGEAAVPQHRGAERAGLPAAQLPRGTHRQRGDLPGGLP
ncbi:hypothetical protein NHX12_023074, partial [Muraenolepis orangiensis]